MTDMTTSRFDLASTNDGDADYQATVLFDALPEAVFNALTTTEGLAGWWAPVSGSGAEGGEPALRVRRHGPSDKSHPRRPSPAAINRSMDGSGVQRPPRVG